MENFYDWTQPSQANPPGTFYYNQPSAPTYKSKTYSTPYEQYWAFDDPRYSGAGDPYPILPGELWESLLRQSGFSGPMYEGRIHGVPNPNVPGGVEYLSGGEQFTPEARAAIDALRAQGYDVRPKHPDRDTYNTYYGIFGPQGLIQDVKIEGDDGSRNFLKFLTAVGGGILGSGALGNVFGGGATNALAGVPGEIAAGGALEGIGSVSGNIIGASGAPIAALPAVGGALTAADLAGLSPDITGGLTQIASPEQVVLQPFTDAGPIAHVQTPNALLNDQYAGFADLGVPADANFAAGMGAPEGMAAISNVGYLEGIPGLGASGLPTAAAPSAPTVIPGAGIAEGMAPGVISPASAAEAAAAAAVASGAGPAAGNLVDKAISLINTPAGQAVLGAAGSVVGGVMEANAAEKAAETQSQAAQNALALQREMFEYQKSLLEPYRTAGTKALERLSGAMGLGGPGSQRQMLEMDPGYGFRLGEGLKALERMQASRGNFLSGGALKAGQRFAQDTASQEYGNAYNRLANIAGLGQTAGTQMGGAAAGFGTSAGNIMGQQANALAAGRIGRQSAYSNAIGGALGSFENYLNRQQRQQMIDIYGRMLAGGG